MVVKFIKVSNLPMEVPEQRATQQNKRLCIASDVKNTQMMLHTFSRKRELMEWLKKFVKVEVAKQVNNAEKALQRMEKVVVSADSVDQQVPSSDEHVMDEEARVVDDASISDGDDATSRGEVLVSVYVLDGDVSWLWKKKPFEKTVSSVDSERESVAASVVIQADQDATKEESYVRISVESYARLTELENQVKDLNRKLTSVHENLSSAQSEIKAKDIIVKQHAKVTEDAISGWEKAEAESLALSHQLESVTVLKLTAEEKVSHLDGTLRECMKQMQKMKEDIEQKLQDVVFSKTKQWEKINADMQARIADFEQKLLMASSENAALSRSLQERSNMLMKITEEKSQADAEIEMLRNNIQSCEKEISSFDYELNILSKELEIRNEEKNMIMRSAEVANKQHSEDVKKITKLEAECQRLRNLVRKKLPGPAALAQMKLEVENLGRDYGENRMRRGSNRQHILVPDFAFENIQQCYKENEFLTSRLLAMEEETKMLRRHL